MAKAKKKQSKKKKREEAPEEALAESGTISQWLGRTSATIILLSLVLYVAAQMIARTGGVREMVRSKIEAATGMPTKVGQVGLTLGLNLKVSDIRLQEDDDEAAAGARVSSVRVDWHWRDIVRGPHRMLDHVTVQKPLLTFRQNEVGAWEPAALEKVFKFLNQWSGFDYKGAMAESGSTRNRKAAKASTSKEETASTWAVRGLEVLDGEVVWRDHAGTLLGEGGPVLAEWAPLSMRNREATYIRVEFEEARVNTGRELRNFVVEVLRGHGQTILINMDGAWHNAPGSSAGFVEIGRGAPKKTVNDPVPILDPIQILETASAPKPPEPATELESYLRDELGEVIGQ